LVLPELLGDTRTDSTIYDLLRRPHWHSRSH
jgi:hypothetical protein